MEILETHIHHFWYGIILLAVSGWLGIHYNSDLIDSVAAVLYGISGGLIMDEVALLLKLDPQAYWFDVTYTMTLIFLAFVSCLVLLSRYSAIIHEHFVAKRVSLYIGLVLTAISTAVITETTNIVIIAISIVLVIAGCIIALTYFVHRVRSIDRSSLSTRQLL
jgi:hypothetical protein